MDVQDPRTAERARPACRHLLRLSQIPGRFPSSGTSGPVKYRDSGWRKGHLVSVRFSHKRRPRTIGPVGGRRRILAAAHARIRLFGTAVYPALDSLRIHGAHGAVRAYCCSQRMAGTVAWPGSTFVPPLVR